MNELRAKFLEEAAGFLPRIREGISSYMAEANPDEKLSEELLESYRFTQTLRVESSRVGLSAISERAAGVEAVLEGLACRQDNGLHETERTVDVDTAIAVLSELDEIEQALLQAGLAEDSGTAADGPSLDGVSCEGTATESEDPASELMDIYAAESQAHLQAIDEGLLRLEGCPDDRIALQDVRRSVHSLKGAAVATGVRAVRDVAHGMEDLLDVLYERELTVSAEALSALSAGADTLIRLHVEPAQDSCKGLQELTARLEELAPKAAAQTAERAPYVTREMGNHPTAPRPAALSAAIHSELKIVRVPVSRLDDLMHLVSELVISRGVLEQRVRDLERQGEELQRNSSRLQDAADRLSSLPTNHEGSADPLEHADAEHHALQGLTRGIREAAADAGHTAKDLDEFLYDFDGILGRHRSLTEEIHDRLLTVRMLPLRILGPRLQRMVRAAAAHEKKRVQLVLEDGGVEMDTTAIDQIVDPLLHLLNNAVAHGIETAETRRRLGKPETGSIVVRAFHENTAIVLQVSDDGGGIDSEAIRRKAVELHRLEPAAAALANDRELQELIFVHGFSTAESVTDIAGRGVGLDAVQDTVRKLHGTINVQAAHGSGATFTLNLPMKLTVSKSVLVQACGRRFAVPLDNVSQILHARRGQIERFGEAEVFCQGGKAYPIAYLQSVLQLGEPDRQGLHQPVLIVRLPAGQVAVAVDEIVAGEDIVIKASGPQEGHLPGVVGVTQLRDGCIVPILNIADLAGRGAFNLPKEQIGPTVPDADSPTVLIVDDSPSVRRVNASLIRNEGWTPITAKDGLDAFEQLRQMGATPRAILLDVEMPRMDGYEFLTNIKQSSTYRGVPVVIVTARSGERHSRRALEMGATDFVTKPCQQDSLLGRLRRLMN